MPLYRDAAATQPNLHPELLRMLAKIYARKVTPQDFAAYLYALLAQPAFTARFARELDSRELRAPITKDAALFKRAVDLGGELLFLHTFGERFKDDRKWPAATVKCLKAVAAGDLPETFSYDETRRVVCVACGEFGPVPLDVWEYEVSGLKVVQSWLGYRVKRRKGRKSSPLDDIAPAAWTSDYTSEFLRLLNLLARTLEIHPRQAALLDEVLNGDWLEAREFGDVPPQWRKAPVGNGAQNVLNV